MCDTATTADTVDYGNEDYVKKTTQDIIDSNTTKFLGLPYVTPPHYLPRVQFVLFPFLDAFSTLVLLDSYWNRNSVTSLHWSLLLYKKEKETLKRKRRTRYATLNVLITPSLTILKKLSL